MRDESQPPERAWIGLGGNQANSVSLLEQALQLIGHAAYIDVLRRGRLFRSPPWGGVEQPEFVNAVAEIRTRLTAASLLRLLLGIETQLGRRRNGPRWGPRCIDLDLLTYGKSEVQSDELELPHPRMHQRAFVLVPLLELEPDFVIPGRGAAAACLEVLDPAEVAAVRPLEST